jgi:hypothetical protein
MAGEILSAGPWAGAESRFWSGGSLNGVDLPGVVRVRISRANNWDRKTAKGSHGETQTFNGKKAADVDITIRVWTEEDWLRLSTEILPLIEPQAGKETPKPLDLIHPVAVSRNVKAILVDSVAGPDANDSGIYEVQIKAFEYLAPSQKNANGTAKGSPPADPCAAAIEAYKYACAEFATASEIVNQAVTSGDATAQQQATENLIQKQNNMFTTAEQVKALNCGDRPPSSDTAPPA